MASKKTNEAYTKFRLKVKPLFQEPASIPAEALLLAIRPLEVDASGICKRKLLPEAYRERKKVQGRILSNQSRAFTRRLHSTA